MYVVLLAKSTTSSQLAVRIAEEAKRKHYKTTGEELKQYVLPDSEKFVPLPLIVAIADDPTAERPRTRNSQRHRTSKSTSLAFPSTSCYRRTKRRRLPSSRDLQSYWIPLQNHQPTLSVHQKRSRNRAGSPLKNQRRRRAAGVSFRSQLAMRCRWEGAGDEWTFRLHILYFVENKSLCMNASRMELLNDATAEAML